MFKKGAQKFFEVAKVTGRRHLWDRKLKYPSQEKQAWTVTQNFFDTITFNGKPIKDQIVFDLFTAHKGLTFRGLSKDEPDSAFNQQCNGLVARQPSVFRDRKNLDAIMSAHQAGNVTGLPTTLLFKIAKSFADGVMTHLPSHKEIMIMDLNNIPDQERYMQKYDQGSLTVATRDEDISYSSETECTISGAHISAIIARMNQKAVLQCNLDYNPLYIDQKALTPELQQDYRVMLSEFYELIQDTPKLDSQKLLKFKEHEMNFYLKVGEKLNYSKEHMDAVLEHLGASKELTYQADSPSTAPGQ